ncbi:flavodoxin family protein [Sporomusa acidovorans]|uniref:NADPH-dependent FMN reductase-like domain-containing protein n=1 Tax=Sporomusa acidovorans (strain ATCC 49682 / DSM 3132 / Mol) TaxID=1123286 RepID=A0ABZ3J8W5_SPOA4|nr:flavodoxin family protein [Sporomusa acidovorans]OZC16173.1 2-amino-4-deoxychorismate dehydrogenase [Sporomusa acidovorans DSM 3132]SDE29816.1 Multimeric flavodoxin WrbA [Sporomusa acidovorans]
MNVLAINGSPRKNWNTAILLNKVLAGAASQGAQTELIHLYDLNFKGCRSCFACKVKNGKSYGKCALQDDLTPVLKKVEQADALILGSPIYFGNVTGEMRSFMERLAFPYLVYDANYSSLFTKKIPIGLIYTMNVSEERMKAAGYDNNLKAAEMALGRILGTAEPLFVNDTYQFDNYSKYVVTAFNEADKAQRRKEVFPLDCEKAFNMGVRFASQTAQ